MGLGKKILEYVTVGVESGQGNRFPRFAGLNVAGFRFPHTVDKDECVFVAEDVFSRTWYQRKVCLDRAVCPFDFGGLYGEVSHAGSHLLEHAIDETGILGSGTSSGEL